MLEWLRCGAQLQTLTIVLYMQAYFIGDLIFKTNIVSPTIEIDSQQIIIIKKRFLQEPCDVG